MSHAADKIVRFPELKADNHDEWFKKARLAIELLNGERFLDEDIHREKLSEKDDEIIFKQTSNLLLSRVHSSLDHVVQEFYDHPESKSPYAIWKKLHSYFQPRTLSNHHRLEKELYNLNLEENKSLSYFISQINMKANLINQIVVDKKKNQ